MNIAVIGLGYVGLPLALQAVSKGHRVTGFDTKKTLVDMISDGRMPYHDDFIEHLSTKNSLIATTTLPSSRNYIVCVPTPVHNNKCPDLSPVKNATKSIASVLEDDQLVVIESTIYPGVCEEIVKPILDATGKKYFLAHCPERINPGDKKWNVSNIPRVVGGIDAESTIRAKKLYESILDAKVLPLSGIREAEATKILENTFRDVNIAFVNEMAQSFYRMGIDVTEVIEAASTKPFAFMPHYPGIGVGGHCIAVDPYYMIEQGRANGFSHNMLSLARKINEKMPEYTMKLIQNRLNDDLGLPVNGTKIGVYGISYKQDVTDDRESPSYEVIKRLRNRNADIRIFDPYLPAKSTVSSFKEFIEDITCLVICTGHKEIRQKDYAVFRDAGVKLIIDGRN